MRDALFPLTSYRRFVDIASKITASYRRYLLGFSIRFRSHSMSTSVQDDGEKSQSRQIQTDTTSECEGQPGSASGTQGASSKLRYEPQRFPERTRTGFLRGATTFGGILELFLEQAQKELANAEECLIWYQREKERAQSRILELTERLSALSQTDDDDDE